MTNKAKPDTIPINQETNNDTTNATTIEKVIVSAPNGDLKKDLIN